MPMQICCLLQDEILTRCIRPIRCRVTKHFDWFSLVNKYIRGKIKRTNLTLTEIWPISDCFIKQKYYCITVHYLTVCASENLLGQSDSKLSDIWNYFRTMSNGRHQTESLEADSTNHMDPGSILFAIKATKLSQQTIFVVNGWENSKV